jgi:hypothetical protein
MVILQFDDTAAAALLHYTTQYSSIHTYTLYSAGLQFGTHSSHTCTSNTNNMNERDLCYVAVAVDCLVSCTFCSCCCQCQRHDNDLIYIPLCWCLVGCCVLFVCCVYIHDAKTPQLLSERARTCLAACVPCCVRAHTMYH